MLASARATSTSSSCTTACHRRGGAPRQPHAVRPGRRRRLPRVGCAVGADGSTPVSASGGLRSKRHPISDIGITNLPEVAITSVGGRPAPDRGQKVGLAHLIGFGSACGRHILEKSSASPGSSRPSTPDARPTLLVVPAGRATPSGPRDTSHVMGDKLTSGSAHRRDRVPRSAAGTSPDDDAGAAQVLDHEIGCGLGAEHGRVDANIGVLGRLVGRLDPGEVGELAGPGLARTDPWGRGPRPHRAACRRTPR